MRDSGLVPASAGTRGQNDQAEVIGCDAATRHWPQSTHMVVPLAGCAAGQRIAGMLGPSSLWHRTCSVSCAQP
jgi:hypothetical protein